MKSQSLQSTFESVAVTVLGVVDWAAGKAIAPAKAPQTYSIIESWYVAIIQTKVVDPPKLELLHLQIARRLSRFPARQRLTHGLNS